MERHVYIQRVFPLESNMASSTESNEVVQFAPFSSAIDAAFWHKLTQNKLDVYHLDDKPRNLQAYFVNSK